MSGKALRLIGGAGTGKTTALMDTMDKALGAGHYRPEDVAFVSFTKAARGEAAARAATRFGGTAKALQDDGWFRTLHSCCYRLLGVNKKQMVTESKKDQAWLLDEIGGRQEHIEGALGVWDYARSTCCHLSVAYHVIKETASTDSSIKLPNTFEDCADIVERYEKAKYRDNRLDFTDLLAIYAGWKFRAKEDPERVKPVGDVPDVPVFFIDEAQDLSALSADVARRLSQNARWTYLAGDFFQSVFTFSGAHPKHFKDWPVDRENTMPKSYRCPPPIMELGEAIIRDCTDYFDRGIAPADHSGGVSRGFLHSAIQYEPFTNGESWMLLARTNWQARAISDGLSRRGIPWMSLDGNSPWNSPARNRLTFALLALEQGRPITSAEWRDIVRSDELPVKGNFAPGLRAAHSRNEQIPDEFRLLTLDELHTVGALPGLVSMIQTREWRRCIPRANEFLDAIEKHGVAATLEPKVSVGTIHSAKGAEADNVILSTAISAPVVWGKNTDEGNNAELRVWYVGATRARKRLIVADDHTARFRQEIPV